MIRNPPDATALIGLVATVLKQDLGQEPSALSPYDRRLMIAALALAARELGNGDAPLTDALAALGPLAPKLIGSEPDATPAENLAALSRLLAAEIRAGKWDGDEQTHEALLRATRAYLAESNPKALARARTQEKPRRDDGA
jgi:hypothetical protein